MKKFSAWKTILGTLLLLGFVSNTWAVVGSTVTLVPTSPTTNLVNGDPVTFDVIIDFSLEGGTLGGGFDVVFDPAALVFVGLTSTDPADPTFDPAFGRDPDILSGLLESWAVGNFSGITGPALVGSVEFQVLPTMGAATIVAVMPTSGIAGPWISLQDFITILNPEYNQVEVRKLGVCGDSEPDLGEQCDDGNTTSGDGCSAVCDIEAGFNCTAAIASIPGFPPGTPPIPPVPSVCTFEQPAVEICTLVTLNPDQASDYTDADSITGDICDAFPQNIPVGVVGTVDAAYFIQIFNSGPDPLTGTMITVADLGIIDVPAPCGDIHPGGLCNFLVGAPGFEDLQIPDVCITPGPVTVIATVDAVGLNSGIPVSDDDPASVECVTEPNITLRKEVSLDGGPFLDADTAAAGPSGALGADAEYRLIVENDGTETLVNALITDATIGLVDVPVPGGPMLPGDIRVIGQGDAGFGPLLFPDRCDSIGPHMNNARVDAAGDLSGAPVDSENQAWVNCEDPQIVLLKQVSLDGVNFFEADSPGDPDVPVGIVGLTDATYRLIVSNDGSETLSMVLVEDLALGISTMIADLIPGETRVIEQGDAGFGNLFQPSRCGVTPGNKSNIASVFADGINSGQMASDDDPANVRCIIGAEIELLKQVSLDGINFVDADTAATGPTGLLGDDATYRMIVRNVGDEDLVSVTIDDSTLGILDETIPDLPISAEVVIDVGSFGKFTELFVPNRCDAVGTQLNIAEVRAVGSITGSPAMDDNPANVNCEAPLVCDVSVDQTCLVLPANDDLRCTDKIAATTLRYTGPGMINATVTFEGKNHGFAQYAGVDLVSGTTILTMAGQNGFTVDAGLTGDKLGSKTTITINGVEEIIDTNCSGPFVAGQPAPLDKKTPNPPNSNKGDPSPNWSVVNFRQKDGGFIQQPSGTGADSCTVPFGGGMVSYQYQISNIGTTNADVTSVLDDLLGELLTSPPAQLAPGDTLNLSAGPVFISQDTASMVNVSANITGDSAAGCPAQDSVSVIVEPPPQLSCSEFKPVTQLSMIWNGASGVDVLTEGGQLFSDVQNGNQITFNTAGLGNEVEMTLSGAVSGTSTFHLSCSDPMMNGPEDCGSNQGNGKDDHPGQLNDWLLDAMVGGLGQFTCNLPNTGVVDPVDVGGVDNVRAEFKEFKGREYKFNVINDGTTDLTIVRMTITWPDPVNGALMEIKRGKDKIFNAATPNSPVTITTWSGNEDKRRIGKGENKEFKLKFQNNADMTLGNYVVEIEFDSGTIVCVDNICGPPDPNTPVGTITEDILRGGIPPGVDRGVESAAVNLVADAQAWATSSIGAQIAFMNPGGVRSDLTFAESGSEGDGVVTFSEAFTFQPFANTLVTFPMTGAQIISVLQEQCQPLGSSRPILHLGVSDGFTYDLATTIAGGDCTSITISNVKLNGINLNPGANYFVTVNSFLAIGGDNFSTFATLNPATGIGGGVDLVALTNYLAAFSPVAPPSTDRVNEVP